MAKKEALEDAIGARNVPKRSEAPRISKFTYSQRIIKKKLPRFLPMASSALSWLLQYRAGMTSWEPFVAFKVKTIPVTWMRR